MLLKDYIKKVCKCKNEFFETWLSDVAEEVDEEILDGKYKDSFINRCFIISSIDGDECTVKVEDGQIIVEDHFNDETWIASDEYFLRYQANCIELQGEI